MRAPSPPPSSRVLRSGAALLAVVLATLLLPLLAGAAAATPTDAPGGDAGQGADEDAPTVTILPVEGFLDPPTASAITDLLDRAPDDGVDLVVLQLRHGGAVGVDTGALAQRVADSVVPVAVFVGPQGTSAPLGGGGLELLAAADVRAAALDARLGPLLPLEVGDATDATDAVAAVDRLGARWPEGAALFADDPTATVVVGDGGTAEVPSAAEDALDRVVPTLDALLAELDGVEVAAGDGTVALRLRPSEGRVVFQSLSLPGRVLHASASPAFVYLLLVVGLGMLLFEVFQPGFGVAGIAGVVAVGLAVAGLLVFPVAWWAVALVVLGLVLFAVDTAIAGFGPVTLAATASLAAGSWWFYDSDVVAVGGVLTTLTVLTALAFFVVGMTIVLRAQAGPVDVTVDDLVGRAGIVRSVLHPEGHVFVDGALWRARWTGPDGRAKVGTPVRVHGTDGAIVLVEPFDPGGAPRAADPAATSAAPHAAGTTGPPPHDRDTGAAR